MEMSRVLPLPVSDTDVIGTSVASYFYHRIWVCLCRNHMCHSLSCIDRLYILHRIAAFASYATKNKNRS